METRNWDAGIWRDGTVILGTGNAPGDRSYPQMMES